MSNDYWNNLVALVRRTEARAEAINSILGAIKSGFDLFPSKTRLYEERVSYCVDSGAANAYVLTPTYAVTLTDGARVSFKALATNSTTSVANVYGLGNVAICNYAGAALSGGEIIADGFTEMRYNGPSAHWRIVNPVTAVASVSVNNLTKNSATDTTPGYLTDKLTTQLSGLTTTQVSGLVSVALATINPGANEQIALQVAGGYVGGFLNGGNKSSQFTPVAGTEYNCDFTASSWTISLSGMTTPQIGHRIKLNCFGAYPPFLLGTANGQTNLYLSPRSNQELAYSSASQGWN